MSLTPTLRSQLESFATRVGTEFKTVYGRIGTLASLNTTAKGSLVLAVNEVNTKASTSPINDSTPGTTTAYSSSKTDSQIANSAAATKSQLIGGASAAFDTLGEIAAQLASDETGAATLTTAVGNRLRLDAAGGYTTTQQTQGQTNLDVYGRADLGDLSTMDLVATFVTALA